VICGECWLESGKPFSCGSPIHRDAKGRMFSLMEGSEEAGGTESGEGERVARMGETGAGGNGQLRAGSEVPKQAAGGVNA